MFLAAAFCQAGVLVPSQIEKLTTASGARFGADISVEGSVAAVAVEGAPGFNTERGRCVTVFRKGTGTGTAWAAVKTLRSADFAREFGTSVSISGDYLAVGTPYRDGYTTESFGTHPGIAGQVWIYRRSGSGAAEDWVHDFTVQLPFGGAHSDSVVRAFGSRVRLSGDMLAVSTGVSKGTANIWLYRRTAPGAWSAGPQIVPPSPGLAEIGADNAWAGAFEVDGNFLVAGPYEPSGGGSQMLVYERNTGGANAWGLYQTISPPPDGGEAGYVFAGAFAVSGNRIAARMDRTTVVGGFFIQRQPGIAIYDRSGTAGSPFLQSWHQPDIGKMQAEVASGSTPRPIALEGDILVLTSTLNDSSGTRTVLDVYAKTGASWDTAARRTLNAGYLIRANAWFPVALSGTVAFAGGDWSSGEQPHQRGVVEYFSGVGAGAIAPLRLTLTRPAEPGTATLGQALAVSENGSQIIAGEPGDDETFTNSGAVQVWLKSSINGVPSWKPSVFMKPPVSYAEAKFGAAVAIDDTTSEIIVGAPDEPSGGSVYVFNRYTGGISTLPTGSVGLLSGDRFGAAIAQCGNFLAVGMPGDDAGGSNTGTVVMYRRSSSAAPWAFQKILQRPASIAAGDAWGSTLDMDGENLAVAAIYDEDSDGDNLDGSVAILMRNQGGTDNWGLVTTTPILPDDTTRGIFGYSLALRGDELVVGSWPFLIFGLGRGEVFCFSRNQGGTNRWGQVRTLYQAAFGATPDFGVSVALTGDAKVAIVGMDNYDVLASRRGHFRCFDRDLGGVRQWTVSSGDDPWIPTTEERFGQRVAAGAETVAIAAPADDAAGTDAGAIYVYRHGAYERWASDVGISGARLLPPAGDWDNDGVANLMEFAIGSDPRSGRSRTGGLTIEREADGNMHLLLTKPSYDLGDLDYTAEGMRGMEYPAPISQRGWSGWSSSAMTMVTDTATSLHYHSTPSSVAEVLTYGILVRLRADYP